jgi:putative Holliday junction resolvase
VTLPGVLLGVDVGSVRIGVAASDAARSLAVPVATVRRGRGDLQALAELGRDRDAVGYVVGLPRTLSGAEGPAAAECRRFARALARLVAPTPVTLVDERLTTVAATQALREAGVGSRRGRTVVDQVAAATLLQGALDASREAGGLPGEVVTVLDPPHDAADETRGA